jgi:hypothetical protein
MDLFTSRVIREAIQKKIRIARAALDSYAPDDGVDNDTKLVMSGRVRGLEEARALVVGILDGIEDGKFAITIGAEHEGGLDIEVLLVPSMPGFENGDKEL